MFTVTKRDYVYRIQHGVIIKLTVEMAPMNHCVHLVCASYSLIMSSLQTLHSIIYE